MPARDAQMILGHSPVTVTVDIYSEVFGTEIALALGKVNDALEPAAEPQGWTSREQD